MQSSILVTTYVFLLHASMVVNLHDFYYEFHSYNYGQYLQLPFIILY